MVRSSNSWLTKVRVAGIFPSSDAEQGAICALSRYNNGFLSVIVLSKYCGKGERLPEMIIKIGVN